MSEKKEKRPLWQRLAIWGGGGIFFLCSCTFVLALVFGETDTGEPEATGTVEDVVESVQEEESSSVDEVVAEVEDVIVAEEDTIEPTDAPDPTETPVPTTTSLPSPTPDPTEESRQLLYGDRGDGFYTVGAEIAVGRWESTGAGRDCYWSRLDDEQSPLAVHFGLSGGMLTVRDGDYEIEVRGCGTWVYIEEEESILSDDATNPKEDGFYRVGVEIASGRWESDGTGDDCFWTRLDDQQDPLAVHFGLAGGVMTVRENDAEVSMRDCGEWLYIEEEKNVLAEDAAESKSDGFYRVGVEIVPGRWESDGTGDDCFWARIDDQQDPLDVHFGLAGGSMTILESDFEVHMRDCGEFELSE